MTAALQDNSPASSAVSRLRRPAYALAAAAFLSLLGSVDTTYATGSFAYSITSPDGAVSDNLLGQSLIDGTSIPATTADPAKAGGLSLVTVDLNGVTSVDARSIALISAVAKNVELAKTPNGARQVASKLVEAYKWNKTQMACLDKLWTSESHWNFLAHNYRSGAQGIAQALPPTKMEIVSSDWRKNPVTQIKWGLSYIKARYGTPCKAYYKKRHRGYY